MDAQSKIQAQSAANSDPRGAPDLSNTLASFEAYKAAVAASKSNIPYQNVSNSGSIHNNSQDGAFLHGYPNYGIPANSSYPQFLYGIHPQSAAIYGQLFPQLHAQNFPGPYVHPYPSSAAQTSDSAKSSAIYSNGSITSTPHHLVSPLQSYSSSTSNNSSTTSSSASTVKTLDNAAYFSNNSSPDAKAVALASLLNTQIDGSNTLLSQGKILSHHSSLSSHQSSLKDDSDSSEDTKLSSKT
jgi:hypothetical protein